MEARAGQLKVAGEILKVILSHLFAVPCLRLTPTRLSCLCQFLLMRLPLTGLVYLEAARFFDERMNDTKQCVAIILKGLNAIPTYAPL